MGTNTENHTDLTENPPAFRARKLNPTTPFVVRWRALQLELAFKTSRLDCVLTEISQIVSIPRRASVKTRDGSQQFRKSFLSDSMAS
jgi:hypothetical protein